MNINTFIKNIHPEEFEKEEISDILYPHLINLSDKDIESKLELFTEIR